jgi:hypothetical protein
VFKKGIFSFFEPSWAWSASNFPRSAKKGEHLKKFKGPKVYANFN